MYKLCYVNIYLKHDTQHLSMDMDYINHIDTSIANANAGKSKIILPLLEIEGMSGEATRHFYNNVCSMNDARYLEIGTWKGSTVCSAMYDNTATVTCIDNWSQFVGGDFGDVKSQFISNFNTYKGNNRANFIEADCYKVDVNSLGKFNIYMYDGDHSFESHYNALPYFLSCMDDTFIYIIDDWNEESIQSATRRAIEDLKLNILYKNEIFTEKGYHSAFPKRYNSGCDKRPWANGCGVFILQKF